MKPMSLLEERTAIWSPATFDGRILYRYKLMTVWDASKPMFVAVLLNPSTADELKNDMTVARIDKRARALGCGGWIVLNIFAWRDRDPKRMKEAHDPVGPDNDNHILEVLKEGKAKGWIFMVGWGNHGDHHGRGLKVMGLFERAGVEPMCLAMNANHQPKHPLYCAESAPLIPWRP